VWLVWESQNPQRVVVLMEEEEVTYTKWKNFQFGTNLHCVKETFHKPVYSDQIQTSTFCLDCVLLVFILCKIQPWKWKQHVSPKVWYTTMQHNPEDHNLNSHCYENIKYYILFCLPAPMNLSIHLFHNHKAWIFENILMKLFNIPGSLYTPPYCAQTYRH
jgi:hypothetical protein